MARPLKITLWIAAVLVLVAGSAPLWAPAVIDWNGQRGRHQQTISRVDPVSEDHQCPELLFFS